MIIFNCFNVCSTVNCGNCLNCKFVKVLHNNLKLLVHVLVEGTAELEFRIQHIYLSESN